MKRDILFRGKCLDNGEWIEGWFCEAPFGRWPLLPSIIPREKSRRGCFVHIEVAPETVGQYTGLKDKNGRKIFEGDIVEYNDGFYCFKGEIVFEYGAFGIGASEVIELDRGCCDNFANLWQLFWDQECSDEPMLYYCEIVGNIHDDKELLGAKEEEKHG